MARRRELAVLTAVLAIGVVSIQYYLHAKLAVRVDGGLGAHLSHVARDVVLAIPVALIAAIVGSNLARAISPQRGQHGKATQAAMVSLVFLGLMLAALPVHGWIDATIDPGVHVESGGALSHTLREALIGQAIAFSLLLVTLALFDREVRRIPLSPVLLAMALAAGVVVIPNPVTPVESASAHPDANGCTIGAPQRSYDVSAISVDMTLNQWGDHDPLGRMFVLDDRIADVRLQELAGTVSPGLRDDPLQALVIRANVGDCLTINFTNQMSDIPASLNVQGIPFTASNAGGSVGQNPSNYTNFNQTTIYRYQVPDDQFAEGMYQFHSGYTTRETLSHGLFGMLVVEPAGSQYMDPAVENQPIESGWEAIIVDPNGADFREFVILFHEIGNEEYDILDSLNNKMPVVDPITGAYRPASRGLNYRSEPFMDRLGEIAGPLPDKSLSHSSYTFGDPATPIPRSYLGEPTKTRIAHPGSEMFHVYHLHGGGVRWRRNGDAEPTEFAQGLQKVPTQDVKSTRMDSQALGPGEVYTLEHECGAGGCQQAAGDFLFHCHIGEHYVAGMWSFWRVHDTQQDDLAMMPDDSAFTAPPIAVAGTSLDLIGQVVEGKTLVAAVDADLPSELAVEEWAASQLPPPGVSFSDADATVWDWIIEYEGGDLTQPLVLGEPEDTQTWPNYTSPVPDQRLPVIFNTTNGRLAWPTFTPHLGKRPPFAPNGHSGAPWLGEDATATRPDGLCVDDTTVPGRRKLDYPISAIDLPIELGPGITDTNGMLYVLNEEADAVRSGAQPAQPLVIRANVGDCLRLIYTSEQLDANHGGLAKTNIHNHFNQFDPQASDGVITGFSYEQSVYPYANESRTLVSTVAPGTTQIDVSTVNLLREGIAIGVGLAEGMCDTLGQPNPTPTNSDRACTEIRTITAINGTVLTLDAPLANHHVAGEAVGVEFVQYNWYADVDDGTVFFHDHVDFANWAHGLFGALIHEPAGSTWRDPATGAEVRSGPVADIHAPPASSVGLGQAGPFREYVALLMNEMSDGAAAGGELSGFNGRTAPLAGRDPVYPFSSVTNGDPTTPILRAYVGDDVVLRSLGIVEREGSLKVTGHAFAPERFIVGGSEYDAVRLGISEREDLILESGAGGDAGIAGDFLIYNSVARDLLNGAWTLFRVHDTLEGDLQVLPGVVAPPDAPGGFPQQTVTGLPPAGAAGAGNPCAPGAPLRTYDVSVFQNPNMELDLVTRGVMYALTADKAGLLAGLTDPEPLVLRVAAGDCVEINLTNDLPERSGLTIGELLFDPQGSHGSAIGFNDDSTVAPAASRTYRFFADEESGTAMFGDLATFDHQRLGAYGAVIVEPVGATWRDPATGAPIESGVRADVVTPTGSFREHVMLFQEDDERIGQDIMPYKADVEGFAGINYASDPFRTQALGGRLDLNPDQSLVYSSAAHGDPNLLVEAYVGDEVRLRVGVGHGDQSHTFGVLGHRFPAEPGMPESSQLSTRGVLPGETFDVTLIDGAGGGAPSAADYLLGDWRMPFHEAGMWGVLRTHSALQAGLLPLPEDTGLLRVTTTPALPAQIEVDGILRDTWSLEWMKIGVGSHDVCFTDISGFTTPACQNVTVNSGATTTVDGAYTERGFLQVNTSPALPSTISIDGTPANDWGVWTDLEPGTYQVCFGDVADMAAPPCEDAVVTAGVTTPITGVFTSSPGAPAPTGDGMLRVTTAPAVPSQISIDGIPADSWSLTWLKLAPGQHEVCFSDIQGFDTPPCRTVLISSDTTTTIGGVFTQRGSLRVDTSPAMPSTILVNLIPRDDWGLWTDIPPGAYDVCFGEADGFAPPCQNVTVNPGALTTVTGIWTP